MARIFASLAIGDGLVLLTVFLLGYMVDGLRHANTHAALAIFAVLLTCLVHVIALTFLIVVGKLTRQAVELGRLDRQPRRELTRLKARVSKWLAGGIMTVIAAVATGATTWGSPHWHGVHQFAGWMVIVANFAAFVMEYRLIRDASGVTEGAFEAYQSRREKSAQ